MKTLTKNIATILTLTTLGLTSNLLFAQPVLANWLQEKVKHTPFDPGTWNPGTWHDGLENTVVDTNTWTKTANDAAQQAERGLQQLGGHIVDGLKSGLELCQEVGYQNCADPNFLQTYVGMKQAANLGMFSEVEPCGKFVHQGVEMGSYVVQAYAQYQGATIPPQAMAIGQQQYRQYGALSCKVLYGSLPSTQPQGSIVNTGGQGGQYGGGGYPTGGITGEEHLRGIQIQEDGANERNRYEWDKREAINQYEWDNRNEMNRREWTTRERINQYEWDTKNTMNERDNQTSRQNNIRDNQTSRQNNIRDNQTVRMGYDHEKEMLLLQMQNQHLNPWQNLPR